MKNEEYAGDREQNLLHQNRRSLFDLNGEGVLRYEGYPSLDEKVMCNS